MGSVVYQSCQPLVLLPSTFAEPNTLVLMQVGSFFEFYGVNNSSEKIGNAQYIAELLNIDFWTTIVIYKNNIEVSRSIGQTDKSEIYLAIKKSVYLNSLENQNGDYIEFGVYKGSSFCHAIKCFKSCKRFNSNQNCLIAMPAKTRLAVATAVKTVLIFKNSAKYVSS